MNYVLEIWEKKCKKKNECVHGIEPWTSGFAILRSTTELNAQK